MINPIVLDFETEAIIDNPIVKPPKPVGVGIWIPGQEPNYLAWGHPEGNNCSWANAHEYLVRIRDSGQPVLCHNSGFDISVLNGWFANAQWYWHNDGWRLLHDTMFLLFLADPYSEFFGLKPSATRYLGTGHSEQDELHDWIVRNIPEATRKTAGAYICRAPADLVGRYCIRDLIDTRGLFNLLHPRIVEQGMLGAYEREQKLLPILLEGTRRGIRIDRETLEWHEHVYTKTLELAEERLVGLLNCSPGDLNGDDSLADALERSGAVQEWVLTKTGKRSMAKDNLKILDPRVKALMDYRSGVGTCLSTFMRPWLEKSAVDGRLHPNWNQIRQAREGKNYSKGTKTGRLSSDDPNFQNVPTEFVDPQGNPLPVPEGLHPYPLMRRYCLPEEGHVWLKRDFSSQEIRILAHFEDGTLCQAYRADPNLDPHQLAKELITQITGLVFERKIVKITGFSIIYGTGVTGLSKQLYIPYHEGATLKEAYLKAMPGVRALMNDVQMRGRSGDFIRTWGGRIYYKEPSDQWDFSYKLLNYLIQGSAADQTKEALNDWEDMKDSSVLFIATVHDEINASAPKEEWERHMAILREAMNKDRFDVPMLSEGYIGNNWQDLEKTE